MTIHVVETSDTIYSIAERYGVTPVSIVENNGLVPSTHLAVGQTLVILFYERVYTVNEDDTLPVIAASNGITVRQLLRNNPVLNLIPAVYPGQTLVISYTQEKIGTITTNGYAYPFVNLNTLRRTLPYLTYMTLFTYGFNPDGTLIIPNDTDVLNLTHDQNSVAIMCISTLNETDSFSGEHANILLENTVLQEILVDNIITTMKEKNFTVLNIDFEYIFATDRQSFTDFVIRTTERLNAEGYRVYVSLAPKTSDDQPGLLYEGHDYASLGAAADGVILMTYEWGYTYGPPMAVAPFDKVHEVVAYAVSRISPEKIFLGIPNYGYDWQLPYSSGVTKAEAVSNEEAVALAAREGVIIEFDETSHSPFFYYTTNGINHVVWFEDARSIIAKLSLIAEFNLRGGSWWTVMNFFQQNWMVTNALFNIVDFI